MLDVRHGKGNLPKDELYRVIGNIMEMRGAKRMVIYQRLTRGQNVRGDR